jgi:hypothetical protein
VWSLVECTIEVIFLAQQGFGVFSDGRSYNCGMSVSRVTVHNRCSDIFLHFKFPSGLPSGTICYKGNVIFGIKEYIFAM